MGNIACLNHNRYAEMPGLFTSGRPLTLMLQVSYSFLETSSHTVAERHSLYTRGTSQNGFFGYSEGLTYFL